MVEPAAQSGSVLEALSAWAGQPWPWLLLAVIGAVLLFGGERLLRPTACLLAVAAGIAISVLLTTRLAPAGVAGLPAWAFGGVVGIVVGVIIGGALWRAAVAVAAAGVVALVAFLGTAVHLQNQPGALPEPRSAAVAAYDATRESVIEHAAQDPASWTQDTQKQVAGVVREQAVGVWESLPVSSRTALAGSVVLGGLAGLLLGGLLPRLSGAVMTAAAGGGVVLLAAGALWKLASWPPPVDVTPLGVLLAWGGMTAVGLTVQVASQHAKRRPVPVAAA